MTVRPVAPQIELRRMGFESVYARLHSSLTTTNLKEITLHLQIQKHNYRGSSPSLHTFSPRLHIFAGMC